MLLSWGDDRTGRTSSGLRLNIKTVFPRYLDSRVNMMTSSNKSIFRVTEPFARGIHWWPVNSAHKGQWRGALMFSSWICSRINGWVNNREAGDLRRHSAHYDVIVMKEKTVARPSYCILNMGIPLLVRRHIHMETPVWSWPNRQTESWRFIVKHLCQNYALFGKFGILRINRYFVNENRS